MPPRSLPPTKKRRIDHDTGFTERMSLIESALIDAVGKNESLNSLADLLDIVHSEKDAQKTSKAIYASYRVFVVIITSRKLGLGVDEAAKLVKTWLLEQLNTYVVFLTGLLKDVEKTLRISALQILFSLQKHLSTLYSTNSSSSSKSQPQFHLSHFRKIVSALLLCSPSPRLGSENIDDQLLDPDVANYFYETWLSVHDDIRWFFFRESATILNAHPNHPTLPLNLLSILERLTTFPTEPSELNAWWVVEVGTPPPKSKRSKANGDASDSDIEAPESNDNKDDNDDWRKYFEDEPAPPEAPKAKDPGIRLHQMTIHQSLHSLASHRAVFTRTWLALLPRLSKSDTAEKLVVRVLNVMHRGILPHLTRPVLIMDWVGACVDYGGSVGLLALNALFILMKDYNLDYPAFYTRLYAFLDRDVLHLKHRARFFRMTELFLSSTHLPAILLASFIKRLSRLSLSAPPAAIVMIIPFIYNTLKKHPALMVMIHNNSTPDEYTDPFLPSEPNPTLTRALESSLWELVSHRSHYHTTVSTLCKIFAEPFTKPNYPLEDFLDHTYATLFETDANRKIKKEPALAIDWPRGFISFPISVMSTDTMLIDDGEAESAPLQQNVDVVGELWNFT
ncbi:CBF-domain-containing protein [Macrolepiota fuliginosa MF-IS2]|uniref:CBF-domain-containing protein n=1 Tax=Macrolepiota fuliginosa MF-IS2 TaxID=1400762 RepID=A0A9P6C3W6_9AGAR|nr:CBF-domain-containing protein [Macrolepiota fuliginosa MF-IS2]